MAFLKLLSSNTLSELISKWNTNADEYDVHETKSATTEEFGHIKVGTNLTIDGEGKLNAGAGNGAGMQIFESYSDLLTTLEVGEIGFLLGEKLSVFVNALIETPNLLFLWTMQEGTGTTANDASGNLNTGTYENVTFAPGIEGNNEVESLVSFNGTSSRIQASSGCSVKGAEGATFMCICEITSSGEVRMLWHEPVEDSSGSNRLGCRINSDNKLLIAVRAGDQASVVADAVSTNALSEGYHLVHFTVDIPSSTLKIYADGVEMASTGNGNSFSASTFANVSPAAGPFFGYFSSALNRYYDGKASFVGVWTRALTAQEIEQHAIESGFKEVV